MRRDLGLTQAELAERAGTSQATIAQYESGKKSPTFATLERLVASLGLELFVSYGPPMTREDQRSLVYHRAVAIRLKDGSTQSIERAKKNLKKLSQMHPHANKLITRWRAWLVLPAEELVGRLLDVSPLAREMRQVSPFAGVLEPAERWNLLKQFRKDFER